MNITRRKAHEYMTSPVSDLRHHLWRLNTDYRLRPPGRSHRLLKGVTNYSRKKRKPMRIIIKHRCLCIFFFFFKLFWGMVIRNYDLFACGTQYFCDGVLSSNLIEREQLFFTQRSKFQSWRARQVISSNFLRLLSKNFWSEKILKIYFIFNIFLRVLLTRKKLIFI